MGLPQPKLYAPVYRMTFARVHSQPISLAFQMAHLSHQESERGPEIGFATGGLASYI